MSAARRKTATPQTGKTEFVRLSASNAVPSRSQVVLVPGAQVPLLRLDLPSGLRGSARENVAGRQLRDLMNLTPENIEFRPFKTRTKSQHWSRVMVADKADIAAWRVSAGAACRAVLPDYLALPVAENVWTIFEENGVISARLGLEDGFSAEPALASMMIARALTESAPELVLRLGGKSDEIDTLIKEAGVRIIHKPDEATALGVPVPQVMANREEQCDLRIDPLATRNQMKRLVLPWRAPVVLALIAVAIWSAALLRETRALTQRADQERAAAIDMTRQAFVPVGPILDVRIQVSDALATLQASAVNQRKETSPLELIARAAIVIQQQQAQLVEISYTTPVGMGASLRVDTFTAQDALIQAFDGADLQADIVQSQLDEDASGVQVDVILKPAARD